VDGVEFGTTIVGCLSPWLYGLVTGFLGVTSNKQILFGLSSRIVFCLISMVLLLKERTMVVLLVYKHLSFRTISNWKPLSTYLTFLGNNEI